MIFFILVGGSSGTIGDLIKPKKSSKKGPKTSQKRANFNAAADVVAMIRERRSYEQNCGPRTPHKPTDLSRPFSPTA